MSFLKTKLSRLPYVLISVVTLLVISVAWGFAIYAFIKDAGIDLNAGVTDEAVNQIQAYVEQNMMELGAYSLILLAVTYILTFVQSAATAARVNDVTDGKLAASVTAGVVFFLAAVFNFFYVSAIIAIVLWFVPGKKAAE